MKELMSFLFLAMALTVVGPSLAVDIPPDNMRPPMEDKSVQYVFDGHCREVPHGIDSRIVCSNERQSNYYAVSFACESNNGERLRMVIAHHNSIVAPSPGKILFTQGEYWNRLINDELVTELEAVCSEEIGGQGVITNYYEMVPSKLHYTP